jgi:alkylation response protein AidB-like acyl-CoA dehydrogenase
MQRRLAEMVTRAQAVRFARLAALYAFDRSGRCDLAAGMATDFASEAVLENASQSVRIHGAHNYAKGYDTERLYRDAPLNFIGEGSNEP